MLRDPVCKMEVDPRTAVDKTVFKGETYYFCSSKCKKLFDDAPEKPLEEVETENTDDEWPE